MVSAPPDTPRSDNALAAAICVFLVAAVWIVFGQTIHHEFVNYDDDMCVYENREVAAGLSWQGAAWAFTHAQVGHWDPLTTMSHMLDCRLFGMNAGGHHLTNALLHTATSVLFFLVLRQMTARLWPSAIAAALFALHPLRVESVAWVTERKDVLSGLFFVLTIGAYTRWVRQPTSRASYIASAVFFALGLMSKSMVITLPCVLLLLDYWPLNRFPAPGSNRAAWRSTISRLLVEKIPLFALTATSFVATWLAVRVELVSFTSLPLSLRIGNALVSYASYVGQIFYPAHLAVFYPHPQHELPLWEVTLALLVLLLISVAVFAFKRQYPYLLMGWLWYLGMLVPVIGIIQSGQLARADRYTYLPHMGVGIALAWLVSDLMSAKPRILQVSCAAGVCMLFAMIAAARLQTSYWRNSEALWTHTLECTPNSTIAHNNFATAITEPKRAEEAMMHLRKALSINPRYAEAHNNLGNALVLLNRMPEAAAEYQAALTYLPNYTRACCNLGFVFSKIGREREAVEYYEKALTLTPNAAAVQNNLAWLLATSPNASLRNGPRAVELAERALRLSPVRNPVILGTLAASYAEVGRYGDAERAAREAVPLAIAAKRDALAKETAEQLKEYEAGRPYRDHSAGIAH